MKVGISTACLYPQETEAALDQLLDAGFDCFEIFLNTISEMEPAYVRKLREKLVQGNAVLKSLHPFTSGYEPYLIFTDYKRRFRDSLDFYKRYFETAQYIGAGILVLHGDKKTPETGISNEEYFEKIWGTVPAGRTLRRNACPGKRKPVPQPKSQLFKTDAHILRGQGEVCV